MSTAPPTSTPPMRSLKRKPPLKPQAQRTPRVRLDSVKNPQPRPIPQSRAAQKSALRQCTNIDCPESNVDEDDGKLVCKTCGLVVQETQITQEITFGESSNGAAVVQGIYVGAGDENSRQLGNSKIVGGMDSRQVTLRNGERAVRELASPFALGEDKKAAAMQVYKLAMNINFIQGRETRHVAAVCLYIACRRDEHSSMMLIDFADLLKVNVYRLGHTYNTLVDEIGVKRGNDGIKTLSMNPENLIYRFAKELDFGTDQTRIAKEAVQILKRMSRDWLLVGRRPAGVCGAALILAARMNNYRRTVREVVYIAKVTDVTISKRLEEFMHTESSGLTVTEFRAFGANLEQEADPPAYYQQFEKKSRKKRRTQKGKGRAKDTAAEEMSDSDNEEPENRDATEKAQADSQAMPPPPLPIDPALLSISTELLSKVGATEASASNTATGKSVPQGQKRKRGRPAGTKNKPPPTPSHTQVIDEDDIASEMDSMLRDPELLEKAAELHSSLASGNPMSPPATQQDQISRVAPNEILEPVIESTSSLLTNSQNATTTTELLNKIPDTEVIPEEEFAGDFEIENFLLTPDEVEIKETLWVSDNADYLRAQQAKMFKKQLAEANGTARVVVRRKRKRGRMGDMSAYNKVNENGEVSGPKTFKESVSAMLGKRAYSTKINYAAVDFLAGEDSSTGTAHSSRRESLIGTGRSKGSSPIGVTITSPAPAAISEQGQAVDQPDEEDDDDDLDGDNVVPSAAAGLEAEMRKTFGSDDTDSVSDTVAQEELDALANEFDDDDDEMGSEVEEEEFEEPAPQFSDEEDEDMSDGD